MGAETSKIQDYAIIGNSRSAALISKRGSIDWLCWPRFDSPSIFGAIVDPKVGGCWRIHPANDSQITRRYIDNTNVLETTFLNDYGKIVLTDFMPVASEEHKKRILWPEHELVRHVRCTQGQNEVIIDFIPRPNYGRSTPPIKNSGSFGWRIDIGTYVFALRSDVELNICDSQALSAKIMLKASDAIAFSLTFSTEGPAVIPPLGDLVSEKLDVTIDWWRRWAAKSKYQGPYERYVIRSALVLKLLSYAPSGAIIAAATTSLPECVGGDLNWDYRFAWLRDESFTVHALFGLGYEDDAKAFVDWLLHATRLTRPELRVLYDVYGEQPSDEQILKHLPGHAASRPVRIGNAASEQTQLGIYGEVVEAVSRFVGVEKSLDRETQKMLRQCGEYACAHWRDYDNGIWEYRDKLRPYTHSRLMCWVALDRLIKMYERGQLSGIAVEKFKTERAQVRAEIEQHAWNSNLQAYTQTCGGDALDASAFLLAYHGFADAESDRMQQTHDRIRRTLSPRPGLLYRDERSKNRSEGAFALCGFWEADFLARSKKFPEAREIFEAGLGYANDVDLFAEQIDPETGEALGNFPQAFTHLGIINAALSLNESGEGPM